MRNYKPKQTQEERDKEVNEKFCKSCNVGILKPHHERPDLWVKCNICGFTKALGNLKK